ncbi:MAG: hypothetical protein M0R38_09445 [Bacteroidia bacterium]|nr:hypothetical protein [Bacteroidia bacterium]
MPIWQGLSLGIGFDSNTDIFMRIKHVILSAALCFTTFFILGSSSLQAQEHSHHDNHKNEIGIAPNPVYFPHEKIWDYGLHVHYIRKIKESKFGAGIGYESIFNHHKHHTFSLVGNYRPIDRYQIALAPGLTFEDNQFSQPQFSFHVETSYEFEFKHFHLGPTVEFAFDSNEYHVSLGIHIGFGF